jgi:hypothetical protein
METEMVKPQPPQQREDADADAVEDAILHPWAPGKPAPSSTVEPMERILAEQQREADIRNASPDTNFSKGKSEDAGLVERLRACARTDGKAPIHLLISAAAALEAKDAEIEYWQNGYADALMQRNTADDTIEAQAREIEALTQINETLLADEKLAQSYIDLREARAEIERLREVLRLTRCRTKGEKP